MFFVTTVSISISYLLLLLLLWPTSSDAKIVNYELTYTYGISDPDGFVKKIILVNGQFPGPKLEGVEGDFMNVTVFNELEPDDLLFIHFHGIDQGGTPWSDGLSITNCPVVFKSAYTYSFQLSEGGTFWYHTHTKQAHQSEGGYGMLIAHEKEKPFAYDYEYSLLVGDWYHVPHLPLVSPLGNYGPTAKPNLPLTGFQWVTNGQSILVSGIGQCNSAEPGCNVGSSAHSPLVITVIPNKTYRFRIVNTGTLGFFSIGFAGHNMTVVKAGATLTQPISMQSLDLGGGERFDVLVTFDRAPGTYRLGINTQWRGNDLTAAGVYNRTLIIYEGSQTSQVSRLDPILHVKAWDQQLNEIRPASGSVPPTFLSAPPDISLVLDSRQAYVNISSRVDLNAPSLKAGQPGFSYAGILAWTVNNISYASSETPLLLASYHKLVNKTDYSFYPKTSRPYRIELGSDVQIIIQNYATISGVCEQHPWHLHGNSFYIVGYGSGVYRPGSPFQFAGNPLFRDTVIVTPSSLGNSRIRPYSGLKDANGVSVNGGVPCGWVAVRFVANNPGMWFFHCHVKWHEVMGMGVVFDVSSEKLWESSALPKDYGICGRVTTQSIQQSEEIPESLACKDGSSTSRNSIDVTVGAAVGSFIGGVLVTLIALVVLSRRSADGGACGFIANYMMPSASTGGTMKKSFPKEPVVVSDDGVQTPMGPSNSSIDASL